MLLGLPSRKPQRSIRVGSSAAPSAAGGQAFSRYPTPAFRAGQGALTSTPNAPRIPARPSGERASQSDFSTVDPSQDSMVPKFGRWLSWTAPTQRFTPVAYSRHPDLYAEWEYPNFSEHQNAQRPTTAAAMARTGGFVRQTDFSVRRRKYRAGPRFNGLLMALPGPTKTFTLPEFAKYVQERGFAIVWATGGGSFPVQFAGLRVRKTSSTIDLCLVAEADAPAGMGGVVKLDKNGVKYAVYLVETGDSNASPIRVRTSTGTKAIRLKT